MRCSLFACQGMPNLNLRATLYRLLAKLSIDEKRLEDSDGLGALLLWFYRDKRETKEHKKLLHGMIQVRPAAPGTPYTRLPITQCTTHAPPMHHPCTTHAPPRAF